MDEQQAVHDALTSAVPAPFLDRLTQQIERGANIKAVFGEPIERNGTTVIPVGRARWAAGSRGGSDPKARMGGAAVISPVGFIEVRDGCATFKAILGPAATFAGIIAGTLIALGAFTAIAKLAAPTRSRRFFERRRAHR